MSNHEYADGPLFGERERRLIDAYAGLPNPSFAPRVKGDGPLPTEPTPDSPRQDLLEGISEKDVKWRLGNGRTSISRISREFNEFVSDLHRVENYYRFVEGSPTAFAILCQDLEMEIERIEMLLDEWKRLGERAGKPPEPLLEAFEPLQEGVVPFENADDYNEFDERMSTLLWILTHDMNESIIEVLRFVNEADWRKQMNELAELSIGQSNGAEYSGQQLAGRKGLMQLHPRAGNKKAYQLTDRGEAILSTIERLSELSMVKRRADDSTDSLYETAAELISRY